MTFTDSLSEIGNESKHSFAKIRHKLDPRGLEHILWQILDDKRYQQLEYQIVRLNLSDTFLARMNYYCLSFDYKFGHANDEIFFAYTIPYSYS